MSTISLASDDILLQEEPRRYLYRGQRYRSLTDRIHDAGFGDDFSRVSPERMAFAQTRGRMVHLACQYVDEGQLDPSTVDARIAGYVDAYRKFIRDCPVKTILSERRLVCESLQMGCTPDWIGFIHGSGRRCVIERKTTQHRSPSARLQTAGQKLVWNVLNPHQPVYERYGLRLCIDGTYQLSEHTDAEDELAFIDALEFSKHKERRDRWLEKYHLTKLKETPDE